MLSVLTTALLLLLQGPLPNSAAPMAVDQWRTSVEGHVLDIDGSTIRLSGKKGWSRSLVPTLDYVLTLDYRLATPNASGAVLVRAVQKKRKSWPESGYRIVLGHSPTLPSGSLVALSKQSTSMTARSSSGAAPDAWHTLEITCRGQLISVRIDDVETATVEGHEAIGGYVGLEHESGTLDVRSVRYQALPSAWSEAIDVDSAQFRGTKPVPLKMPPPVLRNGATENLASTVELLLGTDGSVQAARLVTSSEPDFDAAALATALTWTFTPAVIDGRPARVIARADFTVTKH